MAGRIPESDIAAIRERVRIEDVVGEYVALKPAGVDSLKGLCPFHDEKTPSFHVRPNHSHCHCFGCGVGGDVFAFLQRIEHVGFVEAVEQCADRIGYRINYTAGASAAQRDRGARSRLVAANAAAHEFYISQLSQPEAAVAREYLTQRNFDADAAAHFGCGYAPAVWDGLTKHLVRKGFQFSELEAAGLAKQGRHGPVDRFHRRLLWPIRNLAGEVIGFGARRLFDDDQVTAKYVNTPETVLYKKSQVLFGLDLAKREIARSHQAVVVEGYTDVMAMHLAGVKTAVAACGTAFGDDHLGLLRRLLLDDTFWRGEIIYTFDGDAAGQAAALKAFAGDQKLAGKTYVAVAGDGQDPCELRQHHGDGAVRDLVARRVPLYEFVINGRPADVTTTVAGDRKRVGEFRKRVGGLLSEHDLDTPEGRVAALRRAVPVVARIKDNALRRAYATKLADWVGWEDTAQVARQVAEEARRGSRAARAQSGGSQPAEQRAVLPNPHDPVLLPQRQALAAALQYPALAGPVFDTLEPEAFTHAAYVAVRAAIAAVGGTSAGIVGAQWVSSVSDQADDLTLRALVSELAGEPLPVRTVEGMQQFITGVLARTQEAWVGRQIAELKSRLQRISSTEDTDAYMPLFGDLVALEQYRKSLLAQAMGNADDFALG